MRLRSIAIAGLLTLGALIPTGVAYASTGHVDLSKPCTNVGQEVVKHGDHFRCEQRPGDKCPMFHWLYNSDTPKSGRTVWPKPPCKCSPSPSHTTSPSPTATPSATTSPTAIPTTPAPTATGQGETPTATPAGRGATGTLPVTGPKQDVANAAAKAGGLSLLIGLALYGLSFLRRRRTT